MPQLGQFVYQVSQKDGLVKKGVFIGTDETDCWIIWSGGEKVLHHTVHWAETVEGAWEDYLSVLKRTRKREKLRKRTDAVAELEAAIEAVESKLNAMSQAVPYSGVLTTNRKENDMSVRWTVTRQAQWINSGKYVVEISAGGLDYTNPDALSKKYPGEFDEFVGLVPAVEAAIRIAELWKADEQKRAKPRKIHIGIGGTGGMTMPFDGIGACKTNYKLLRRQAKKHDAELPKCAHCGDILSDERGETFGHEFTIMQDGEYPFCSENCANLDYEECLKQLEEDEVEVVED